MKPHWYLITVHYCPLCGRDSVFKERQYTERPAEYSDRHKFHEHFDWCEW